MAVEVTVTLEEQGMMGECIESMKGCSKNVCWFDCKNCKFPDGKFFFINIECTVKLLPYLVSMVAKGMERTGIMNPSPHGAEATLGKTAAASLEARGFLREHAAYYRSIHD